MSKISYETKLKKSTQIHMGDTYAKHAGDEYSHRKANRRLRLQLKKQLDKDRYERE